MKKTALLLVPAFASMVVAACSTTTSSFAVVCGPDSVATTNSDVVVVTNYEAAFYYASLDPIPAAFYAASVTVAAGADSQDGSDAAVPDTVGVDAGAASVTFVIAAAVNNYFENRCATATASGNKVTFQLNNCTGPLGLVRTTGTVTATINVANKAVQVQLSGSNIAANGATINLSTSGTLTTANGQKTLRSNTQTNGTGPDGNSVMHSGMYTLVWPTGTGCATINGTLSGVGSGTFSGTSTQIVNYVACANKCPQSGNTTSSFNGGTTTLTFNGSASAQCTSSDGTSASLPLSCP